MKHKDDQFIKRHFIDLAMRSYERGLPIVTDFLDMHEQGLLQDLIQDLPVSVEFYGGYDYAQRQVAVFGQPDAFFEKSSKKDSLQALRIRPKNLKFTEDLNHRDYLGALMHLGIERELIGDILVQKDHSAIVFCINRAMNIISDLHRIRHTEMVVETIATEDFSYEPVFREDMVLAASNRLDAFLASAAHLSRKEANILMDQGKVFLNARECYDHNHSLREGDLLSIRGIGKLEVMDFPGETKKGKQKVHIRWFDS